MTDWLARCLDEVDDRAAPMTELLCSLVRSPSITGSDAEHEVQERLAGELAGIGLDIDHWEIPLDETVADEDFPGIEATRSEAWGLVARRSGASDGPALMFNAHIDVVPPGDLTSWRGDDPFSGHVVDDSVHGRGACDMKGGLVAALWAVAAIHHCGAPLRGDLLLACVESEEDGGLGTFATLRRGWRADACVIPEPTSLDLMPASAGALTFRLQVPGLAAHGSRRTEGVSALDKLVPVLTALRALEARRNVAVDPLMRRWPIAYPISIGRVSGGVWPSSVPDLITADGRYGVALDESPLDARRDLEIAVVEACAADPWLRDHPVEIQWWGGQFGPGRLPADSDLLERMRRAHTTVAGGRRQETWGTPYGSDLRLLTAAGIPTLNYGPGDGSLAHAPNEAVPLAEVRTAARALTALALDICGLAD
ncbi:MAG TPA: ArgE/DapE family deacylase [Mycobacteriales bacterium]|nr:ArgE/DapE family deacylase [Mycobacteriales bacterium]